MKLTAYHPVMREGVALFPIDCADASAELDGYVFDVVLRNRSIIASPLRAQAVECFPAAMSGDVACMHVATFGHNVHAGCFNHAYFGTEAVVRDLKTHPDWCAGEIVLHQYTFLRAQDEERRVVGMQFSLPSVLSELSAMTAQEAQTRFNHQIVV